MSSQDNNQRVEQNDNLKAAYQELCSSYHAIDDFRAKLLGFLPLASAGGIVILLKNPEGLKSLDEGTKYLLAAVGAFGGLITLGLFAYELYGIKKCGALIQAGQFMEQSLLEKTVHIDDGPFCSRPQNVARIINEPFAASVIYPAVLAAWVFFALHFARPTANPWIPIFVFIVGCAGTLIYDYRLRTAARRRHARVLRILSQSRNVFDKPESL
jgi:hypothetical protein